MTDKPEVKTIFAEVRRPRGTDPGAAVEGRYILEDGAVVLTNHEGTPVRDDRGKLYRRADLPRSFGPRLA